MKGTWPENLYHINIARFRGSLGSALETDIRPLQTQIASQKHPWNIISFIALFGGAAATIAAAQNWNDAVLPAMVTTAAGFIGAHSIARKKDKTLRAAKSKLSLYIQDKIGLHISDVSATHQHVLQNFSLAGFLSAYDRVHYLAGFGPVNRAQSSDIQTQGIQSIATKLTRTETETYTDTNGRRQTRQRTVKVFEGVMLNIDVPEFGSDNRTLITSRRTHRMRGPFDRVINGNRQKMDKIKTASPTFNKYYKVRTDDSTLGHLFLDPDRIMRLNNLYADLSSISGKKRAAVSIMITQGKAWVALETNGMSSLENFSGDFESFDSEIGAVIGQAALPHIIAQHLKLPAPVPYAWQDYALKDKER